MGCLVFWLWAICVASADLKARISARFPKWEKTFLLAYGLLFLALMPRMYGYLRHPQQDYSGMYRTFMRAFPAQKKIFCFSSIGSTGLTYYARQNGLDIVFLTGKEPAGDSLWRDALRTPAVMVMGNSMSAEIESALKSRTLSVKTVNGLGCPLSLHFLESTPNL